MQEQDNNQDFFTKRHKMGFVFLILSMILVVIVWYIDFKTKINYSAVLEEAERYKQDSNSTQNISESFVDKKKDTDLDGLPDYDELNIYKTSPFLPDTDGDGLSDYDEIIKGTDPNCPEGQNCYSSENIEPNSTTTENILKNNTDDNQDLTEEDKNILNQAFVSSDMSAQEIRSFLLQNGVKEEELSNFSDEQLLETYNGLMNKVKN